MVAATARELDRLTPFDRELLSAIQASADQDGAAHSLFQVAVINAGLHYGYSVYRLKRLEALGYVTVQRRAGLELVMKPSFRIT